MADFKFKIESGVEIPPVGSGFPRKYPFHEMEVGDSFEFPKDKTESIRAAASWYGTRSGKKFSVRGNRCWRVA